MAWTAPRTWVASDILTAAQLNEQLRDNLAFLFARLPPGLLSPYAGTSAPTGWLLCTGEAVLRASYPDLYAAVGDAYGAGDGTTTFNLPDMRGRVPAGLDNLGGTDAARLSSANTLGTAVGEEEHTLTTAEMPSHSHGGGTGNDSPDHGHNGSTDTQGSHQHTINTTGSAQRNTSSPNTNTWADSGAFNSTNAAGGHAHNVSVGGATARHAHSIGAEGGGGAHSSMQPTLVLSYIIKT